MVKTRADGQLAIRRLRQFFIDHRFALFVVSCIIVAIVMTGISLVLYQRSGAMKLDMSRPGYESVRTEVEKSNDDQPYSSSGAFDDEVIQDFENRIDKYRDELNNMGDYDNASITDESLNLIDATNGDGSTQNVDDQTPTQP